MRKVFVDCGVREGDGIAAFLGDTAVGFGAYARCLRPREDALDFEFIGFESPNYRGLQATRDRFSQVTFTLHEKLVWVFDGEVPFDSDGDSVDCRLLEVSCLDEGEPWRHPNPAAVVLSLPCVDLSRFLLDEFADDDYVVLKMDIEGAEYDVLNRVIEANALTRIRELYVEYHWWGRAGRRGEIETRLRRCKDLYYRNDWP